MKAHFRLVLLLPILSIVGCAYNATTTLYKTPQKITVNRIGFVNLTSDSISQENYSIINELFHSSITSSWQEFQRDSALYLNKHISFFHPDTNEIIRLCDSQQIDGLILSSINLIPTNTSYFTGILIFPIPLGTYPSFDSEVKLKLFDKNGKLLISNSFYTRDAGKSQSKKDKIGLVIKKGVKGAVRGLIKEMKTSDYTFYD